MSETQSPSQPTTPEVAVIMGSQSDWPTMKNAVTVLQELGVTVESRIVSAHRTPQRMVAFAQAARERGLRAIVAGAGGAAHLPGMVAALTTLPVFGVPIESRGLKGLDSLLSIVQMPGGIPVGTLAIGSAGARNAGLLAAAVVGLLRPEVATALESWRTRQSDAVAEVPRDDVAEGH